MLQVLSETQVLIKRASEQWLKAEVAKWQRSNSFEATDFKQ